ncbi:MAG: hypothetical protein ABSH49_06275 [Bryobacteraceae bacterium]|jgi:hypothetical protein
MGEHEDVKPQAVDPVSWDEQMDRDSSAGKLDFLFEEAESKSADGLVREWPPRLRQWRREGAGPTP